jgi:hypothetical protein
MYHTILVWKDEGARYKVDRYGTLMLNTPVTVTKCKFTLLYSHRWLSQPVTRNCEVLALAGFRLACVGFLHF